MVTTLPEHPPHPLRDGHDSPGAPFDPLFGMVLTLPEHPRTPFGMVLTLLRSVSRGGNRALGANERPEA